MPVAGVGVTAVAVAAARALESDRPDRLVDDPYAAALVEASGVAVPFPKSWPTGEVSPVEESMLLGAAYIGLRTRFIDDELRARAAAQVAVLGSGLDTRAWRLDWPDGTTVFELDSADVVAFVEGAMSGIPTAATRIPIPADVTGPWASAVVAAGLRPDLPTHWVLEGLLPYLTAHDQAGVLDDVLALSGPGSRAVIERAPALTDTPETRERLETLSLATGIPFDELLARTDPPDPAEILRHAGWLVEEVSVADLEQRYARPLTPEREPGADPEASSGPSQRGGFVIARRPAA
ncbi:SAM-dependent methyltransferase [Microbacterium candidum]|uniref:S-adenosyl-L-methionine-dependent methyltransferase n=1 Tax=Microbacterium candidum TaxID=3041922 RepID=A0ABT7MX89_9MICO|nr:SAM-dependent methyltransferase [Microbacterium sp. ASV49]MDL9979049.1 SAM-dependent methyltransferase [Microbacterium sp. ASV49]